MSSAVKTAKTSGMGGEILRLAGILFLITAVVAAALGYVNSITKDKIAAIQAEKVATAMREIAPGADDFKQVENFEATDDTITAVYEIIEAGEKTGLCIEVAPSGFGGPINMIVGVSNEGAIMGVKITSMSETAGLGTKAQDPQWLAQFDGLTGPLNVVKNSKTADNDIVAISASTVTSKAVTTGVQAALDFANSYQGGLS